MVYSTRRFVVCLSVCHFVLVFFSPFSIAITSLGEERANLSAFRTFVRFVLVWICRFPLPLGVWEGLRFVIVALPGLFSYLFLSLLLVAGCDIGVRFSVRPSARPSARPSVRLSTFDIYDVRHLCQSLYLTELSARDTPIFSFPDDNLSKSQGILTKLGTCIDLNEI